MHWNSIEAHNIYLLKGIRSIHNRTGILACTFPIGKKEIQSSCVADEAGCSTVTKCDGEESLVHVSDKQKVNMWLLCRNNEPGFTSRIMKPLNKKQSPTLCFNTQTGLKKSEFKKNKT